MIDKLVPTFDKGMNEEVPLSKMSRRLATLFLCIGIVGSVTVSLPDLITHRDTYIEIAKSNFKTVEGAILRVAGRFTDE